MTAWIDEDRANPCRRWREMGKSKYLSRSQAEQLEVASCLVKEPFGLLCEGRTIRFEIDLPLHAVVAVTLELASEPSEAGGAA